MAFIRSVADLVARVDLAAWEALRAEFDDRQRDDPAGPMVRLERNYSKYFDLDRWLKYHLHHARQMQLHAARTPLRILDIGCGAGLFLFIAKAMGHSGIGIDVGSPMYARMADVLGVDYRTSFLRTGEPLDAELTGFDWITAVAIKFDRSDFADPAARAWRLDEWRFLLADLAKRLTREGHLYLKPNRTPSGDVFEDPAVAPYLAKRAAVVTSSNEFILPRAALA